MNNEPYDVLMDIELLSARLMHMKHKIDYLSKELPMRPGTNIEVARLNRVLYLARERLEQVLDDIYRAKGGM